MPGKVAASILSADFARLGEQIRLVEPHADLVHVDVMDAHFVPPLSIGPVVVGAIRRSTDLPLHCHLMVDRPEAMLRELADVHVDIATFHVEAVDEPALVIGKIESLGMRPGLALSPDTPVEEVFPHVERLDRVLVMSVRPGWSGQEFLEGTLPRLGAIRAEIERQGLSVEVEVDGGINAETGPRCLAAGATVLAAASSIFKAVDPAEATRRLSAIARTQSGRG
ncbi:MAG: ribulose-phosphate 3-epimerase [Actinobacteria bacterium]|nr:ribulose-phosphate 3-epimerase [Actinomycetota bacterium]